MNLRVSYSVKANENFLSTHIILINHHIFENCFLNDVKQNEFLLWTPFLPQIKTFIFFTIVISENLHKDQTTNLH